MNVLLVYPEFPDTFWSFKHALKLAHKKASSPPLGLLTLAALLPAEWHKRLMDMNATKLTAKALKWADAVVGGSGFKSWILMEAGIGQEKYQYAILQKAKPDLFVLHDWKQ